jgi:argininosuccinate lyase
MTEPTQPKPVWDRGEPIDPEMLAFTIGDDSRIDRRLVEHDLAGSLAHAAGLRRAGLLGEEDHQKIADGLRALRDAYLLGEWTVEDGDEDVHSAVERRLIERIGDAGKRLHTGRSRNEQIAVDVRLWLREAAARLRSQLSETEAAALRHARRSGSLPLPGYTHLRRAMPSSVADWIGAFAAALAADRDDLWLCERRARLCPLGSGAGYGVPLALDRRFVALELGFEGPDEPVTHAQWSRGRAELAYASALEAIALDLGKWAFDLWLFTTKEFGFAALPTSLTTGSSLMPQKRNPDLLELLRAHSRQVVADRAALLDAVRDLPSGYHRDFQLVKGTLFRAHDRVAAMLPLVAKVLDGLQWNEGALRAAAADPDLRATERVLDRARQGVPFRDAYREESRGAT